MAEAAFQAFCRHVYRKGAHRDLIVGRRHGMTPDGRIQLRQNQGGDGVKGLKKIGE